METGPYFVRPPDDVYTDPRQGTYVGSSHTYTQFNYLRPGPIARFKRARFEVALRAYLPRPGRTGTAVDMGCADGVFLPSLCRHFKCVVGIDIHPGMLATADSLVRRSGLQNVRLICSNGLAREDVRVRAGDALPADVAFVLETLEHVGTPGGTDTYGERAAFVRDLFTFLEPDGRVVASVPRMVGVPFLAKHLIQSALRIPKEPVPVADVFRSGFLKNTDRLEPQYTNGHHGFNDEKLSRTLHEQFAVEREFTTAISRFFVLRQR